MKLTALPLILIFAVSCNVHSSNDRVIFNPFVGATGYVDLDYAGKVEESLRLADSSLKTPMSIVKRQSTAVWLDSIEAIDGYNGQRLSLEEHLSNAVLQQQEKNKPLTISIVLYALPNRDCAALASNGTLTGDRGLQAYKQRYLDRVAELFEDERFSRLRIVTLIEPDSLPNLVTNQSTPGCQEAYEKKIYANGIAYALSRLSSIRNVYNYLDFGHSGWLGWDNNRARAVELYASVVKQSGSLNNINGVVTNVSGYTPVEEFLLPDPDYDIDGKTVKSANFYEYNSKFDERDFAEAVHEDFIAAGFSENFGVLIDTSRNGWGGEQRPEMATWRATVNGYVDAARLDRRFARGHWCNQAGAGIGELPRTDPFSDGVVHAFVWVKPPGESDGTSDSTQTTPDEDGKSFDPNCDSNGTTSHGLPTGALPNAPAAGAWFSEQFEMLVRNAFPPLR